MGISCALTGPWEGKSFHLRRLIVPQFIPVGLVFSVDRGHPKKGCPCNDLNQVFHAEWREIGGIRFQAGVAVVSTSANLANAHPLVTLKERDSRAKALENEFAYVRFTLTHRRPEGESDRRP